jgi:SPP1 gp7 family putative phage head morphogenesis protein
MSKPPSYQPPKSNTLKYERELKKVARMTAHIIEAHTDGDKIISPAAMAQALELYAQTITPWANLISAKATAKVAIQNEKDFLKQSKRLGEELKNEYSRLKIAEKVKMLQQKQSALIKSIPTEAGERARKIAQEALLAGKRPAVAAAELAASGTVTSSRAVLIARTEMQWASSVLTKTRAELVGADQYIWRTSDDSHVRPSHAEVSNKVFNFDNPPTLSDGTTGNAGEFPNCRCWAEPIIE